MENTNQNTQTLIEILRLGQTDIEHGNYRNIEDFFIEFEKEKDKTQD